MWPNLGKWVRKKAKQRKFIHPPKNKLHWTMVLSHSVHWPRSWSVFLKGIYAKTVKKTDINMLSFKMFTIQNQDDFRYRHLQKWFRYIKWSVFHTMISGLFDRPHRIVNQPKCSCVSKQDAALVRGSYWKTKVKVRTQKRHKNKQQVWRLECVWWVILSVPWYVWAQGKNHCDRRYRWSQWLFPPTSLILAGLLAGAGLVR